MWCSWDDHRILPWFMGFNRISEGIWSWNFHWGQWKYDANMMGLLWDYRIAESMGLDGINIASSNTTFFQLPKAGLTQGIPWVSRCLIAACTVVHILHVKAICMYPIFGDLVFEVCNCVKWLLNRLTRNVLQVILSFVKLHELLMASSLVFFGYGYMFVPL